MPFLKVCVALYDYDANTEEELTIKENDILYLLEDDDPEWWKAKLKTADPNELLVGLIPSNYVEPVGHPAIHSLEHFHSSTFTRLPCGHHHSTTQHTIPHHATRLLLSSPPLSKTIGNGSKLNSNQNH